MDRYLIIGLGGFLGAIARYLVGGFVAERFGSIFPFGTLLINLTGSFVLGFFLAAATDRFWMNGALRLFFAIGFLGAYTTFSTFTFESMALIQQRSYLLAFVNVGASALLGLLATYAGIVLGRLI